jgi:hypothetical protein
MDIDNTASSWFDFLQQLAAEADRDAAATDTRFALHGVLTDLAHVARAYSGRLELERTPAPEQSVEADAGVGLVADPAVAEGAIPDGPVSPSEPPDWLLSAFQNLAARVEDLEGRVSVLEQSRTSIPVGAFGLLETEVFDEDRTAWNSVTRARAALRGMIGREHKARAAARQAILARVVALALAPDNDSETQAEIRQHQQRADELATIDAIAGVKVDEVEAIDDLLALREYDVKKGWPQ